MGKLSRLASLQRLFHARRMLTAAEIAAELGCSEVTAKRLLREVRERYDMPISWDAARRAYVLGAEDDSPRTGIDVPGLWLDGPELGGLVTLQTCLATLAPGPIGPMLAPIGKKLATVVARSGLRFDEVQRRVRILPQPGRPARAEWSVLTEALLARRRVDFTYDGRSTPARTRRTVSPQRLVLYRGSWYLDAWCHLREALRSFAVERIATPRLRHEKAKEIPDKDLDQALATSYGIFAGAPTGLARLRFSAFAARWVGDETWHPRQAVAVLPDGGIEVSFPIGRREELVMDVLRWGPEVEVLAPADLRAEVAERLARAAGLYGAEAAEKK